MTKIALLLCSAPMAKVYTLKEAQYVRDDVAMNVALLRYMRFFSNGVEINPLSAEDAARYDSILEKIGAGLPLGEIAELQQVLQEVKKAEERRRVFREFKKRYRQTTSELVSQQRIPTREEVTNLLHVLESNPLASNATSEEPALDRLIAILGKHPNLAHDEHIDCRYIRHLLATDFGDNFYFEKFWESLLIRHAKLEPKFRLQDGYALDFPEKLVFSGSSFSFTGKFKFGTRRKCRDAVITKGAAWIDTPTGSTDFLVISANGENTSPNSTKVSACMALKSKGYPCFALAEEFWVAHLNENTNEIQAISAKYANAKSAALSILN